MNIGHLRAEEMCQILFFHDNFLNEKTQVEHIVNSSNHKYFFLPSSTAGLGAVEADLPSLENFYFCKTPKKIVSPGLDSVPVDPIRKYFRKVREYERVYLEGKTGKEVRTSKV